MRVALGVSYRGQAYQGWQSQPGGRTVQDCLETALGKFADQPLRTMCAGRTDAGVHALNQVVHLDCEIEREPQSWIRGTNRFLPSDIAVQWCRLTDDTFHARYSAIGRRYVYMLLESAVRPSLEVGATGWSFRPLDGGAMQAAAKQLIGEHDFSAFRAAECQALSAVKVMRAIDITQRGAYWRFHFDASAFLHHMVRNIVGCLVAVGSGTQSVDWLRQVRDSGDRRLAARTYAADGLYFYGPYYDPTHAIPDRTAAMDWLP